MDGSRPVFIVFHGYGRPGPAEQMVAGVRAAAARNNARTALSAGFEAVVFATDDPAIASGLHGCVLLDLDSDHDGAFDFDARLRAIIARFGLERPVVMGSGSLPLAVAEDYQEVRALLEASSATTVTNNFFSSDLTGWTPGSALSLTGRVARDNALPRRLRDDAGLPAIVLPRSTRTLFDIDTPADVAVLALQSVPPAAGGAPGAPDPLVSGDGLEMVTGVLPRYRAVMRTVCDSSAELVVAGRVGSGAWQYLETETACRVRLLSEERGLAASGREHRARSVLGYLLEAVGIAGFFERACTLGDAVVIDTRVIEAHLGLTPKREDRFQSDLMEPGAIEDPFLRDFTAAAAAAPKPVLLGGHSLVSGGLMALTDAAWREHDERA